MNEIVLQEGGLSLAEMSAELGASSTSTGPSIPELKMNYDGENGPMGSFFLKTGQNQVYATEGVRFRAFSNHIQFQHWGADNSLINKSLLVPNEKVEARDQLGGLRCNVPTYDQSMAMSLEEKKKFEGRDKYRVVRGLISYTGTALDGQEVTIENQPCVIKSKRKNYGPFYYDVVSKLPQGMKLWDFENILSKETKTNSHGKKYYIMHFAPQYGSPIEMDQITYDSLSYVRGLIASENKKIEESHKAAMIRGNDAAQVDRIDTVIQALDADVA
tara:strand:- start:141 stop:959 length:819 start_codon:yes stop_codon:yes gene_type:complete